MRTYTGEKDSDKVQDVFFWLRNVTRISSGVGIWISVAKCGLEFGLGFVDLVPTDKEGFITSIETRRYYGPIVIKFKEIDNEDRSHRST